ncbi:lysophospholipid acyltransferase family protein [Terricaulis sp.]|uniref:lysophospholipid acyltransferase family protein n=1 Tax=Terricaulis sp. TaxID=2768686 RepID=UPI003784CF92
MDAREVLIDGATARPAPYNGLGSEIVRWISGAYLRLSGWRIRGDWPGFDKAVLVAAPHTSNWDGLNMLATAGYYRVKLKWMGKKSLTTGPFGWVLKAMGCVPIDRSASHDVVRTMADVFAREPKIVLAIPPEGTRSAVREWKSGFYHIAHAAKVPLVLSVLDYGKKTVSLAATFTPSGDYDADLAAIRAHYANAVGKKASNFVA